MWFAASGIQTQESNLRRQMVELAIVTIVFLFKR
jgi:hypothetical protein